MRKQSNKNALVHGVYSSDIVLPWEKAEDFNELLKGIRLDFMPNGTTEDDIVFEIAVLHWKKRRFTAHYSWHFCKAPLLLKLRSLASAASPAFIVSSRCGALRKGSSRQPL